MNIILNKQISSYWDNHSKRYRKAQWTGTLTSQFDYEQTKRKLLRNLRPKRNEKILEIGCGPGIWTQLIAKNCFELVAIDISKEMIDKVKNYVKDNNVKFINCNFLDFEVNEKFDKIFSVRVIEYIPNKIKLFKKISKLLVPNGELVIITKTKKSIWDYYKKLKVFLRFYNRNKFNEVRQYSWFENLSLKFLKSLIKQNNLSILNISPVIIRLPIFKRGNDEIPLITKKLEKKVLKIFNFFSGKLSKMPIHFQLFIAESYLIHAKKKVLYR